MDYFKLWPIRVLFMMTFFAFFLYSGFIHANEDGNAVILRHNATSFDKGTHGDDEVEEYEEDPVENCGGDTTQKQRETFRPEFEAPETGETTWTSGG